MGAKKLTMYLGNDLTGADRAKLSLHICGETFSLSTAQHHDGLDSYTWSNVTLDWSLKYFRTVYLSVSNTAATGMPTITGFPLVGFTLTAGKGTIADAEGVPAESTFTYQWIRVEGANETDIAGATSSTYTPVAADAGKKIKVRVGFTDNGRIDESRTSDAYPATDTIRTHLRCDAPNLAGRTLIWTGNLTVGTFRTGGIAVGYGFLAGEESSRIGNLDEKEFSVGSNDYEIDVVRTELSGGKLNFSLDADLTIPDRTALRLHVCDASFDFDAATTFAFDHDYRWDTTLDWSPETGVIQRTLHLSTRTKPHPLHAELENVTGSFSTVTLTYDRLLNESSVPQASHFTTSVGTVPELFKCGSGDTAGMNCFSQPTAPGVTNVEVSGNSVVLTLDAPYPQRYIPSVGEWHVGMYVKYNARTNAIQSKRGTAVDNSCGRAQDPIPLVGHYRLLGCFWTNGYRPSYTGPGMSVTRTSPTLSQLSGRRITDIEISGPGERRPVDERRNRGHHGDDSAGRPSLPMCNKAKPSDVDTGLVPSEHSRKIAEPHSTHAAKYAERSQFGFTALPSAPSSTGRTRACASRPIQFHDA